MDDIINNALAKFLPKTPKKVAITQAMNSYVIQNDRGELWTLFTLKEALLAAQEYFDKDKVVAEEKKAK